MSDTPYFDDQPDDEDNDGEQVVWPEPRPDPEVEPSHGESTPDGENDETD